MVSTLTLNRQKKITLLKESLNGVLDLLLLQNVDRDNVNMRHFKELSKKVKEMQTLAK